MAGCVGDDLHLQQERLTKMSSGGLHPGTLDGYDLRLLPIEIARGILRDEFEAEYYVACNHDVDFAAFDAFEHYHHTGWREGRDPSSRFSTRGYLQANADIADSDINPLLHYVVRGRTEGRRSPSPSAVPTKPSFAPPDLGNPAARPSAPNSCGVTHAVEMKLLRDHFDPQFYAEQYADMRRPGTNQLEHYCVFGWKERRDPCAAFSTRRYLQDNRDVADSGVNPFFHYILLGRNQGRTAHPSGFAGPRQMALNPDAQLVRDLALRDMIRFVPRQSRQNRQKYDPGHLVIDWVVPDFSIGSGGHMTLFRIIRWLEFFGHSCRIWLTDLEIHGTHTEIYDDIVKHFQTLRAEVRMADDGLTKATGDVLFATGWQTVARAMSVTGFRERAYLVQDLEFSFYPEGSHANAVRWTYTQDLACICASPWLAETLSAEFGRWTRHFALAYNPDYYTPTLRKSGKPPCQSRLRRFCFIHDPPWLPGQRIAQRPD